MNLTKTIGLLHLGLATIENSYGLISNSNYFWDKYYLISSVCIPISWLFFKDECIISYIVKKIENPKYKLGDRPNDIKDIAIFFTNNNYLYFSIFNSILRVISFTIANNRSFNISYYLIIPINIMYFFYSNDINFKLNLRKRTSPYFDFILSYYLLTFLYIISKK